MLGFPCGEMSVNNTNSILFEKNVCSCFTVQSTTITDISAI